MNIKTSFLARIRKRSQFSIFRLKWPSFYITNSGDNKKIKSVQCIKYKSSSTKDKYRIVRTGSNKSITCWPSKRLLIWPWSDQLPTAIYPKVTKLLKKCQQKQKDNWKYSDLCPLTYDLHWIKLSKSSKTKNKKIWSRKNAFLVKKKLAVAKRRMQCKSWNVCNLILPLPIRPPQIGSVRAAGKSIAGVNFADVSQDFWSLNIRPTLE